MLEVLISLLILGIGLLGLASLQAVGMQNNHSAYLRSHASFLSYEIIDAMRSNRDRAVNGAYNFTVDSDSSFGTDTQPQRDLSDWRDNLTNNLPGGSAVIAVDSDGNVSVRITWIDDRRAGADQEGDGDAQAQEGTFVYATEI